MTRDIGKIKNFLLDMDGTVYLGDRLIEGAPALLEKIKSNGGRAVFLTNNSSKSPAMYVEKLRRLGSCAKEGDVFTSGDAAALSLIKLFGAPPPVFLLGTECLRRQLEGYGLRVVNGTGETPRAVLLGFDMTLNYEKIYEAHRHIVSGVPFFATHPDMLCPAEGAYLPDAGCMIELFKAASGVTPEIFGKPCAHMAGAVREKFGFDPAETAMVGDRLETDIAFANNGGLFAVLVLSGEATVEVASDGMMIEL